MTATIHLVKLSVRTSSIGDLQKGNQQEQLKAKMDFLGMSLECGQARTRITCRRINLLGYKGVIQCRQKIIRFDEVLEKTVLEDVQ